MHHGIGSWRLVCAAALALAWAAPAPAATITIDGTEYYLQSQAGGEKNDCAGELGIPPGCVFNGSYLMGKYDWKDGGFYEFEEGFFGSVTADDFDVSDGDLLTGTFAYWADEGDPLLRYWATKGGAANYTVWWITADDSLISPGDALPVPTGVPVPWTMNHAFGLSHISFYDTYGPPGEEDADDEEEPDVVAEPGSLALIGVGLAVLARRLRTQPYPS